MRNSEFIVDFVARGETSDEWLMVLVEAGPWHGSVENQLTRLQNRLYGCIDAAIDGQVAAKFPESNGKRMIIQVDGYSLPADEVENFFARFSEGAVNTPEYQTAIENSEFVESIGFRLRLDLQ